MTRYNDELVKGMSRHFTHSSISTPLTDFTTKEKNEVEVNTSREMNVSLIYSPLWACFFKAVIVNDRTNDFKQVLPNLLGTFHIWAGTLERCTHFTKFAYFKKGKLGC